MLPPKVFEDHFTEDLFEEMLKAPFRSSSLIKSRMYTDVRDLGDRYELEIELPGYTKDDVSAALQNGYLTIRACKTEEIDDHGKRGTYVRKERYTGECQRSFQVGKQLTEKDIKGKFENGILILAFPKLEDRHGIEEQKLILIE